jgi:hypothetical protein
MNLTHLLRASVTAGLLAAALSAPAYAESEASVNQRTDVRLVLLRYNGDWNPRPHALSRLAWEIRKRTSIAIALDEVAVEPTSDELLAYPLIFWLGDRDFAPLPEAAVVQLRQHLTRGGTLLVDLSDGAPGGGFDRAVRRELGRILPGSEVKRLPTTHVLYKSFYLLDRHGGRVAAKAYLEGLFVGERLAVVISSNDLAGAMARDQFGQWEYEIEAGGDAAREASFRLGINLMMYALCLDYKEDQVHIPFILQRRR